MTRKGFCLFVVLGVLLLLLGGVGRAATEGLPVGHWVWNRPEGLSAGEVGQLKGAGCDRLWWNLGTLEREGTTWKGAEALRMPAAPEGMSFIPVVRLQPGAGTMESDEGIEVLARLLGAWCRHHGAQEMQVDYDCPDRLLGRYAGALARVREAVKPARLSATALAHWPRVDGFAELCRSVDELAPMYYDLETAGDAGVPRALAEAKVLQAQFEGWKGCPAPWRAGLPNFTRVSVLAPDGRLSGQLEEWRWEELTLHPALAVEAPTLLGVTVLRVERDVTLGRHPLRAGGRLVVKWPDLGEVREGMKLAEACGARGVIFFKLPRAGSPSGWSLETVKAALEANGAGAKPGFELVWEKDRITLRNVSGMDLPPRFASKAGARDAGWTLELELDPASVLDLGIGEFALRDNAIEKQSGRVTLRFTSARSHAMIRSGYIQCVTSPSRLRWCIPEVSDAWQETVPPSR